MWFRRADTNDESTPQPDPENVLFRIPRETTRVLRRRKRGVKVFVPDSDAHLSSVPLADPDLSPRVGVVRPAMVDSLWPRWSRCAVQPLPSFRETNVIPTTSAWASVWITPVSSSFSIVEGQCAHIKTGWRGSCPRYSKPPGMPNYASEQAAVVRDLADHVAIGIAGVQKAVGITHSVDREAVGMTGFRPRSPAGLEATEPVRHGSPLELLRVGSHEQETASAVTVAMTVMVTLGRCCTGTEHCEQRAKEADE